MYTPSCCTHGRHASPSVCVGVNPFIWAFAARLFFNDKACGRGPPSVQKHMQTSIPYAKRGQWRWPLNLSPALFLLTPKPLCLLLGLQRMCASVTASAVLARDYHGGAEDSGVCGGEDGAGRSSSSASEQLQEPSTPPTPRGPTSPSESEGFRFFQTICTLKHTFCWKGIGTKSPFEWMTWLMAGFYPCSPWSW